MSFIWAELNYKLFLNLMPAALFKKVGTGAAKDLKKCVMRKKNLTTNKVNWRLFSNIIYSEKSISVRHFFSALKMGRGSLHCEILSGQILLEFKNNVSM